VADLKVIKEHPHSHELAKHNAAKLKEELVTMRKEIWAAAQATSIEFDPADGMLQIESSATRSFYTSQKGLDSRDSSLLSWFLRVSLSRLAIPRNPPDDSLSGGFLWFSSG